MPPIVIARSPCPPNVIARSPYLGRRSNLWLQGTTQPLTVIARRDGFCPDVAISGAQKIERTRMGGPKREIASGLQDKPLAMTVPRRARLPHSSLRGGAPFAPTWQSLVPKVYWGSKKRDCHAPFGCSQ